jgi:hypothetical protein
MSSFHKDSTTLFTKWLVLTHVRTSNPTSDQPLAIPPPVCLALLSTVDACAKS